MNYWAEMREPTAAILTTEFFWCRSAFSAHGNLRISIFTISASAGQIVVATGIPGS
jgi:hypothetical protein